MKGTLGAVFSIFLNHFAAKGNMRAQMRTMCVQNADRTGFVTEQNNLVTKDVASNNA